MRRRSPAVRVLDGAVAVVTGAGSGIGCASALALARHGVTVHVADLDIGRARDTVAEAVSFGGAASAHFLDVTDSGQVAALADAVYDRHGRVDVLHNNAGIAHAGPTEDVALETWRQLVDVNVMGVVHGVHAFLPRMLAQPGGGHIINTASMLGLVGAANLVPYAMTKHALVGLSESLAAEMSGRGVAVTALCPGMVNTRLYADATLQGSMAAGRSRALWLHDRFGASPDTIGAAVIAAVQRPRIISPVPRHQVTPAWWLRRLSPQAAQPLARLFAKIMASH